MQQLKEACYSKILGPLKEVAISNLFARSVVEKHVKGKVYVDDMENPETFYVVHPYGMSLLFGNAHNEAFNRKFKEYSLCSDEPGERLEWMQAWPSEWDQVLTDLYGDKLIKSAENTDHKYDGIVELNTRVNFQFNLEKYLQQGPPKFLREVTVFRTDEKLFHEMTGSVVPSKFWNNAEDFLKMGLGFSLFYKNQLASTAYTAFAHDHMLELGIETKPAFRGKGLARMVCSVLINYCIEHGYEPVWTCRLENRGSYELAKKLGFEPFREIPYYRLGN